MTQKEIVTALRCCANHTACNSCELRNTGECLRIMPAAADLIENQQRHIEALLQANAALRDTVLRRDAQIADMSDGLAQVYVHPKGRYTVAECKGVRETFFPEDVEA